MIGAPSTSVDTAPLFSRTIWFEILLPDKRHIVRQRLKSVPIVDGRRVISLVTENCLNKLERVAANIKKSLENKFGASPALYSNIEIKKNGRAVTFIDFIYMTEGILSLFKITAGSKTKNRKRGDQLLRATEFFKTQFVDDFNLVKGYVVSYENYAAAFDLVLTERITETMKQLYKEWVWVEPG